MDSHTGSFVFFFSPPSEAPSGKLSEEFLPPSRILFNVYCNLKHTQGRSVVETFASNFKQGRTSPSPNKEYKYTEASKEQARYILRGLKLRRTARLPLLLLCERNYSYWLPPIDSIDSFIKEIKIFGLPFGSE